MKYFKNTNFHIKNKLEFDYVISLINYPQINYDYELSKIEDSERGIVFNYYYRLFCHSHTIINNECKECIDKCQKIINVNNSMIKEKFKRLLDE